MLQSVAGAGFSSFLPLIPTIKGARVVMIASGGLDSYTLMNHALASGAKDLHILSFDYGQKHARELAYAETNARRANLPFHLCDIESLSLLFNKSALIDRDAAMPVGHYHESHMRETVVPGRNTIMLSIALAHAQTIGANCVLFGAHAGDHFIYPDCRPEYVEMMDQTMLAASEGKVRLLAPYIHMNKAQIVQLGMLLNLDYANTWTCYQGNDEPCLECGACRERLEAFVVNGAVDPLLSTEQWEKFVQQHIDRMRSQASAGDDEKAAT